MKVRISVSIDDKTLAKLKVLCAKEDKCISKIVSRLINKYMEKK